MLFTYYYNNVIEDPDGNVDVSLQLPEIYPMRTCKHII